MNLDEALRLSPVGHAVNMTLVAERKKWGYQDDRVPLVIVPFTRESNTELLRVVIAREVELPESDDFSFVPVGPDDLTPAESMHPDWEPVVTTDPVLNAAHLAQLDE